MHARHNGSLGLPLQEGIYTGFCLTVTTIDAGYLNTSASQRTSQPVLLMLWSSLI